MENVKDLVYEKAGIFYFYKPYSIKYTTWLNQHLDCDSIVENGDASSDIVNIICFASSEEYNIALRELRDDKYPNNYILQGISGMEVNCID